MLFLYNLGIRLYTVLIQLASLKSFKAKAWIQGRQNIFKQIQDQILPGTQHIWFHFASLGEFEQGRPVLESMRHKFPNKRFCVTFFSPSGYEVRKNSPLADHIFYLPVDSKKNAERFLEIVNPSMAIFTKYEYWFYYFTELKSRRIPLYIISAIFRESQPFFKWYGSLHRKMLECVTYFFVQNEQSKLLLKELNIEDVVVSGDTRFDRVYDNAQNPKQVKEIEAFCDNHPVFIAGSTWLPDEKLLSVLANQFSGWRFIIAPHEIGETRIKEIEELFKDSIRYSDLSVPDTLARTLIIDNIGMLSSLYQYGSIAYIGGGFGAGIHNTLEAAAFGIPVIFGPEYHKFQEAKELIEIKAAFSIKDEDELNIISQKLRNEAYRKECGNKARNYVEENTGATQTILQQIADL